MKFLKQVGVWKVYRKPVTKASTPDRKEGYLMVTERSTGHMGFKLCNLKEVYVNSDNSKKSDKQWVELFFILMSKMLQAVVFVILSSTDTV